MGLCGSAPSRCRIKSLLYPRSSKAIAAGMLFMLVAASIVAVGWQTMHAPDSVQTQLAASLTPLPDGLSTAQLQALQQTSPPPEPGISKTQQLLAQLYT